jgi:hypothetical protein
MCRDEEVLILEFEFAKASLLKKFKAFLKEPGQLQEVRIPLHEIASLSPGWGWGRPPRSLILRVTRLSALAGMPGTRQGVLELFIPPADRPVARRLLESIAQGTLEKGGPDPTGSPFDRDQARTEVGAPATGMLVSGVLTFFSWPVIGLVAAAVDHRWGDQLMLWPELTAVTAVPGLAVSGVLITGAVAMRRLCWYPVAATASIVAMIPWSPAWLLSLPFGIWACNVLGRPAVAEAFFSAERGEGLSHAPTPKPRGFVAGRFLSLVRSIGRYVITLPGRKSVAADPQGAQSSTQSRVPPPTVDYAGEPRERGGAAGHDGNGVTT